MRGDAEGDRRADPVFADRALGAEHGDRVRGLDRELEFTSVTVDPENAMPTIGGYVRVHAPLDVRTRSRSGSAR